MTGSEQLRERDLHYLCSSGFCNLDDLVTAKIALAGSCRAYAVCLISLWNKGWPYQCSLHQSVICTGFKELGPEDVSLLERCPHFRGWYAQPSMELGPEDVSLLERCPHFRGWYVQALM